MIPTTTSDSSYDPSRSQLPTLISSSCGQGCSAAGASAARRYFFRPPRTLVKTRHLFTLINKLLITVANFFDDNKSYKLLQPQKRPLLTTATTPDVPNNDPSVDPKNEPWYHPAVASAVARQARRRRGGTSAVRLALYRAARPPAASLCGDTCGICTLGTPCGGACWSRIHCLRGMCTRCCPEDGVKI